MYEEYLSHSGVIGQRKGIRRYQDYGHGGYISKSGGIFIGERKFGSEERARRRKIKALKKQKAREVKAARRNEKIRAEQARKYERDLKVKDRIVNKGSTEDVRAYIKNKNRIPFTQAEMDYINKRLAFEKEFIPPEVKKEKVNSPKVKTFKISGEQIAERLRTGVKIANSAADIYNLYLDVNNYKEYNRNRKDPNYTPKYRMKFGKIGNNESKKKKDDD